MKKIILRKDGAVYVKEVFDALHCDFCGEKGVTVFESEFDSPDIRKHENVCMQICYDCVDQLYKIFLKG